MRHKPIDRVLIHSTVAKPNNDASSLMYTHWYSSIYWLSIEIYVQETDHVEFEVYFINIHTYYWLLISYRY